MKPLLFGVAILGFYVPCLADTLVVDPGGGGDYTEIQPALDAASESDIVLVEPGQYLIADALRVPAVSLVLRGAEGADATTVRRLLTPEGPTTGVLTFLEDWGAETPTPVIEGLTLTGESDSAAGVRLEPEAPRAHFKGCVLSGTWGPFQATLSISNGSAVLEDCTVTQGSGAGILLDQGSNLTLLRCTVSDNGDRAIGCTESTRVTLRHTTISGNSQGVLATDECSVTAEYSTLSGNAGSGVSTYDSRLELRECRILQNGGAGVRPTFGGDVRVVNCLISGNSGGGVCSEFAHPEIVNCTVTGNSAVEGGGVSWVGDSVPVLTNCIVWGNTGGSLAALEETVAEAGVSFSIVEGDRIWPGTGNRNDDPLFAGESDFHLQSGSPAIDGGTGTEAPMLDLEGYARPCGDGVDMGAYESGSCLPIATNLLGEAPDPVVQDGRAVAYIGWITFPPSAPSVLERVRFRDAGRGNAATLVTSARLYADDGDGAFSEADAPLGTASDFDPVTQELLFDRLAYGGEPGSTLTYFLVCDVETGGRSSPALPLTLAALLLLYVAGTKRRRAGWLFPVALLVGGLTLLAGAGCGSDGGSTVVVHPSRELQLELLELKILGPTDLPAAVDGLPSTAWPFEV